MAAAEPIRPQRPDAEEEIDDLVQWAVKTYGPDFSGVLEQAQKDAAAAQSGNNSKQPYLPFHSTKA